jgi:hypothetical protein
LKTRQSFIHDFRAYALWKVGLIGKGYCLLKECFFQTGWAAIIDHTDKKKSPSKEKDRSFSLQIARFISEIFHSVHEINRTWWKANFNRRLALSVALSLFDQKLLRIFSSPKRASITWQKTRMGLNQKKIYSLKN